MLLKLFSHSILEGLILKNFHQSERYIATKINYCDELLKSQSQRVYFSKFLAIRKPVLKCWDILLKLLSNSISILKISLGKPPYPTYQQNSQDEVCTQRLIRQLYTRAPHLKFVLGPINSLGGPA